MKVNLNHGHILTGESGLNPYYDPLKFWIEECKNIKLKFMPG